MTDGPEGRWARRELEAISMRPEPWNFNPGHCVHWIQAKKAAETLQEAEGGRIVDIDQRGIFVEVDGELRKYGTRDKPRVAALVERCGPKVRIQHRWAVMHISNHLVSIRGPLQVSDPG